MFNYRIISMFILSIFCATSTLAEVYTARPHAIFIDNGSKQQRLKQFLMKYKDVPRKELIKKFKEKLGVENLTGFAGLFTEDILVDLRNEIINGTSDSPPQGHADCETARHRKKEWHDTHSGQVPEAFGRIVKFELSQLRENHWVGNVDICTWLSSKVEYYLKMVFFMNGEKTMRLVKKQNGRFPDTLDPSTFQGLDVSKWN